MNVQSSGIDTGILRFMSEPKSPIETFIQFQDATSALSELCDKFGIPRFDEEDSDMRFPLPVIERALRLCRRFEHGFAWGRSEGDDVQELKRRFFLYDIATDPEDEDSPPFMTRVLSLVMLMERLLSDKNKELVAVQAEANRRQLWLDEAKSEMKAAHDLLDRHGCPNRMLLPPKHPKLVQRILDFVAQFGHGIGDQCTTIAELSRALDESNRRTFRVFEIIERAIGKELPHFETWDEEIEARRTALNEFMKSRDRCTH